MKRIVSIGLSLTTLLLLSACAAEKEEEPAPLDVSGAKTSVYITLNLLEPTKAIGKPSALLGAYSSLYLAQGVFLPVKSAQIGIESQEKLLEGQVKLEASETFALLKEFGIILQVDVTDILNRSTNREETLDKYLRSLANIMTLADRKIKEMEALSDKLKDEAGDKKKKVRDVERIVSKALKNEEFELAGSKQEELTNAKTELAELEAKRDQVEDVLKPYEKMMDIAKERLNAINKNKRIIIAGLKVVDVPGIEELDILQEESWRDVKKMDFSIDFGEDSEIFGE